MDTDSSWDRPPVVVIDVTKPELNGLNIGLVAADDALRGAVRMLLLVSGFHVREYRSAGEYLAQLEHPHHCLVVDCSLPHMSGRRLCRTILAAEDTLPVVAVTAWPEEIGPLPGMHLAMRVLRKPFDGQRLLDAIEEAIGAAGGDHEPAPDDPPERVDIGT